MTLNGMGYKCSGGETWDSVALDIYGDEKYAAELLNANPSLCLIPIFCGGEILTLPDIDLPENQDEPERMPDQAPWKEG